MVVPSLSWQIFGVSVEQGLQKGDFRTGHASSLMKLGLPDASAASHTASAISAEKARSPQRFVCLSRVCLGKQTVFSVNNGSNKGVCRTEGDVLLLPAFDARGCLVAVNHRCGPRVHGRLAPLPAAVSHHRRQPVRCVDGARSETPTTHSCLSAFPMVVPSMSW
jgi:hypothetical protein